MLMTDQPASVYQRDSARVEKRGRCTTTTVPLGWARTPTSVAAFTARPESSGQYGSAAVGW